MKRFQPLPNAFPAWYSSGTQLEKRDDMSASPATPRNNLASANPALAAEWSPRNEMAPADVTPSSNKKVFWQDELGHEWEATVNSRQKGARCPYCSSRKVLAGFNDLASSEEFAYLLADWADDNELAPEDVMPFANARINWECHSCGHKYSAILKNRTIAGTGCRACGAGKLNKSKH